MFNLLETELYLFSFDSPMNACRCIAIWLTVAMVIAFSVCMLLLKGETRKKFLKIGLIVAISYAVVLALLFLTLSFIEDGIVAILFYPLLALIIVFGASAIAFFFKRTKKTLIIAGACTGVAVIATLICMTLHFTSGKSIEMNWITEKDSINTWALWLCAVALLAIIVLLAFVFGKNTKKGFDSRSIAFAAVCIAMSFALSYLRIVKLPQGGSITVASLLPLMLYSYMFGTKKGVFAGLIYGVLQAFQDTYILHPAQFLLDYPLAFSAIGLAGMFAKFEKLKFPQVKFALGALVAGVLRLLMHFISGVFAFGEFAPEGQPVAVYSILYQLGYIMPDLAIVIVVGVLLLCSKSFTHELNRFAKISDTDTAETVSVEE